MFEPENDIERLLMRASAEPAERPAFARALMDAQIVLVLVPDGPITSGPDGNAVIPEGTKMTLPSAVRGEERLIPFFTARSRAQAWYRNDHVAVPEQVRDLFARYPGAPFVLNPGSDYGKEFTPGEVARMLAGDFDLSGPQAITTTAPQQIMLAHPKEIPTALIEALARELAGVKSVRGAWLMLAMRAGESRAKLDAGRRSQRRVAGCSRRDRPRPGRRCSGRPHARRHAARGQFARLHLAYRNSHHAAKGGILH